MPQYAIRSGNLPAEVNVNGGIATNFGPGTVFYSDSQDVTPTSYEGSLAVGGTATLEGTQWFTTNAPRASLFVAPVVVTPGGSQGPRGLQGLQGVPGIQGIQGIQGPLGPEGADGTGFQWKGNWSSGTAYVEGDVAFYNPGGSPAFTSFICIEAHTNVTPSDASDEWDGITIAGPAGPQGPQGTVGPQGLSGAQGPVGPTGVSGEAVSNAVLGEQDRYYKTLAATLRNNGSPTFWEFDDDTESRPQNLDALTSNSEALTVEYGSLLGSHIGSAVVTPDESLKAAGYSATIDAGLAEAQIHLIQDKRLSDRASWDTDWELRRGIKTPFTLSGLDRSTTDFAVKAQAITGNIAHYRFSEVSGSVLDDASSNAHDGAIVSTGHSYGVAGGIATEPGNKALKTAAGGSNELTFGLMSFMTQAAFGVVWYGKLDPNATVVFRDASASAVTGYWVGYTATNGGRVAYRYGTTAVVTTTVPWSQVNDGGFHLVVLTASTTNVFLYIDGVLVDSKTNKTTTALNSPWRVGRTGQNGSVVASQAVTMDELAFYNALVSEADVKDLWFAATNTGVLTVTHEETGNTDPSSIALTPAGASLDARPVLLEDTVTTTSFGVEFRDPAGDLILGASTDMNLDIARTISQRRVNPQNFEAVKFIDPEEYGPLALATGPRSYYRLDEVAASTSVVDLGSTPVAGTVQSGVTMGVTGLLEDDSDTAAQFDGAQGKITFPNPNITLRAFGLSVWFECTGAGSVGGTTLSTIIGWSTAGTVRRILLDNVSGSLSIDATGSGAFFTAAGVAPLNVPHFLAYTWDREIENVWIDGEVVASRVATSGPGIATPLILGSYLSTSTNYSFKGFIDEFILWDGRAPDDDELLALWASGSQQTLRKDVSIGASISLFGLLETFAPAPDVGVPQPLPAKTPLPAGDTGGGPTHWASLVPHRASMLHPDNPLKKALPADVASRNAILLNGWTVGGTPYAGATSDNWRRFLCSRHGYDPDTPSSQQKTNFVGASQGLAWSDISEYLYVVPADQPKRDMVDTVTGFGAQVFNDVVDRLGGLPIPADARPHATPDRYMAIYQPSTKMLITIYSGICSDPATVTLSCTGSPTAGSVILKFLFLDSVYAEPVEFTLGTFIHHNATAAEVETAIRAAKVPAGTLFQNGVSRLGGYQPGVVATGGPLNVAPIVLTFPTCEPLRAPGFTILENSLNAGTIHFTYHNAGPIDQCRLGAIITPSTDGVVKGLDEFMGGAYADTNDGSALAWRSHFWPATATGMDMFSLIPGQEEIKAAMAAGPDADLGHCLLMSTGQAQQTPFAYVPPANRADGLVATVDGSAMPEGARMAIRPDADLSYARPEQRPILLTMQRYGILPMDKTGIGIDWGKYRTRGFPGYTLPTGERTQDLFTLYGTASNASHLYNREVPWHLMQFIDPNATW